MLFQWYPEHQQAAFEELKQVLTSAPVPALFNVGKAIEVRADSSQHGVRYELMQEGRSVTYGSCTPTPAQSRHAQTEKEAPTVACKNFFYHFFYGAKNGIFAVHNDHKLLMS